MMTLKEAQTIARIFEGGAATEGYDNVRDMCDSFNEAGFGFTFTLNDDLFIDIREEPKQ